MFEKQLDGVYSCMVCTWLEVEQQPDGSWTTMTYRYKVKWVTTSQISYILPKFSLTFLAVESGVPAANVRTCLKGKIVILTIAVMDILTVLWLSPDPSGNTQPQSYGSFLQSLSDGITSYTYSEDANSKTHYPLLHRVRSRKRRSHGRHARPSELLRKRRQ